MSMIPSVNRALLPASLVLAFLPGVARAQDMTPPQLTAFSFSPTSIDTSSGSANVTVNFTVTDDSSGAAYLEMTFLDPYGIPVQRASSSLTPGLSVTSSVTLVFPRFSSAGAWSVGTVFVADVAGNTTILNTAALQSAGFPTSLSVTSASDTTPPNLTGLSLSPSSVDTTSAPATLAVNFTATDDLSGANDLQVMFQSPSGSITETGNAEVTPSTMASGSASVAFPQFSESGTWTLESVLLTDAAGNVETLNTSAVISKGFPTTVTVVSTKDVTPPSLTTLSFSPSSADVGNSDAVITLSFMVTDDISGVNTFQAAFTSPSGASTQTASATFSASTSYTGMAAARIPKGSETGSWTLTSVFLSDAAGNTKVFATGDLAAKGIATSLSITSGGASSAPVIVPTVTPPPGMGGWNTTTPVTVTWSVTDPTGITSSSGCSSTTLTMETAGLTLTCTATNGASITGSASVTVQIDTTPPIISPTLTPPPNANGWNNTSVSVTWNASDPISNIAFLSGCVPTTLLSETSGVLLSCSATNGAGLSNSVSVTVKIDETPPTLNPYVSPDPVAPNGTATATSGAADALSGVASQSCGAVVTSSIGTQSVTCTATDNAGNSSSATTNYIVTSNGNLTIQTGQTFNFVNDRIAGNVVMTGGTVILNNTTVSGNFQMSGGSLTLLGNSTVQGNLQITGGGTFSIGPGHIGGNLQIQNLPVGSAQNQVCGASVNGTLQFQDNGTAVLIGSPTCAGNTINGSLQITSNSAATEAYGNTVGGSLQVTSNSAPTQVDNNNVSGTIQLVNNTASTAVFSNTTRGILQCTGNNASMITGGGNTAVLKQGQCASF